MKSLHYLKNTVTQTIAIKLHAVSAKRVEEMIYGMTYDCIIGSHDTNGPINFA
jgi:hypothetical protein